MRRTTTSDIRQMKASGDPIPMVTAYDYTAARLVAQSGIPMILVGDSMGQTMLGHENTLPVTVEDVVRATAAVVRGAPSVMVVADMPFMSYQISKEEALRNAGRLVKEGGAQAVKLEGGSTIVETVQALDDVGIAVMGHLGLTPQSVHKLGGYRVQGTSPSTAKQLLDDALLLQDAGAFSIVLELIPVELAREVTTRLSIPTIGIGSGIACDGQVQVWHDILGLSLDFMPRHARKFAEAGDMIRGALETYAAQVRNGSFPTEAETVHAKRPLELDEDTKSSRVTRLHPTVAALEEFVSRYPAGEFAEQAESLQLEVRALESAVEAGGEEALRQFAADYPDSELRSRALERHDSLVAEALVTLVPDHLMIIDDFGLVDLVQNPDDGMIEMRAMVQWRGDHAYALGQGGVFTGQVTFLPPEPSVTNIGIAVVDDSSLIEGLQAGHLYLWRGGDLIYEWKDISTWGSPDEIATRLEMPGFTEYAVVPSELLAN